MKKKNYYKFNIHFSANVFGQIFNLALRHYRKATIKERSRRKVMKSCGSEGQKLPLMSLHNLSE